MHTNHCLLKGVIENVVGLNGEWKSPWWQGEAVRSLGQRVDEYLIGSTCIIKAKSSTDSLPSSKRGNSLLADLSKDLALKNIQSDGTDLSKDLPLDNIQSDVS
jgi:hypothetical protein